MHERNDVLQSNNRMLSPEIYLQIEQAVPETMAAIKISSSVSPHFMLASFPRPPILIMLFLSFAGKNSYLT